MSLLSCLVGHFSRIWFVRNEPYDQSFFSMTYFIWGLFYDPANISDFIASNGRMMGEQQILKDTEVIGLGLNNENHEIGLRTCTIPPSLEYAQRTVRKEAMWYRSTVECRLPESVLNAIWLVREEQLDVCWVWETHSGDYEVYDLPGCNFV